MRNIREADIQRAVIHILDNTLEEPVLNDMELEINQDIYEFLLKHILKSASDDEAKCANFKEGSNIFRELSRNLLESPDNFLDGSREIAKLFFKAMKERSNIPSGDLVICIFNCEFGPTLGILKLDYNKTYIHSIDYRDDKLAISILPQMIGLPGSGQRLQKCAFINFTCEECSILILDKQVKGESEDQTQGYFLNDLLNYSILSDRRDITKKLIKTSEEWIRENLKDDASRAEKARNVFSTTIKSDDTVNIEAMADYAFDSRPELKEKYLDKIRKIGIDKEEVPIDREWAEKKLKRKRLKIDKDIEIYIDSRAYEDNDRFEIKRNGDGTINIILKHVRNYIEKQ